MHACKHAHTLTHTHTCTQAYSHSEMGLKEDHWPHWDCSFPTPAASLADADAACLPRTRWCAPGESCSFAERQKHISSLSPPLFLVITRYAPSPRSKNGWRWCCKIYDFKSFRDFETSINDLFLYRGHTHKNKPPKSSPKLVCVYFFFYSISVELTQTASKLVVTSTQSLGPSSSDKTVPAETGSPRSEPHGHCRP